MQRYELLEKILNKAIINGFDVYTFVDKDRFKIDEIQYYDNFISLYNFEKELNINIDINTIIFNHNFSKTFFKDTKLCYELYNNPDTCYYDNDKYEVCTVKDKNKCGFYKEEENNYLYFLREMVTFEEPLKYLKSFL